MFTTALFDFDGTLVDSLDLWNEVDKAFFARRGLDLDPEYIKAVASMTLEEAAVYTICEYELEENPHVVVAEWMSLMKRQYAENVEPKPGAINYLFKLKGQGIKLALVTASDPELCKPALDRLGLGYVFDAFIYSGDMSAKDSPEFFNYCSNILKKSADECMVFEDTLCNLKAAKAAGMQLCGVYDHHWEDEQDEIKELCDMYIKSFEDML